MQAAAGVERDGAFVGFVQTVDGAERLGTAGTHQTPETQDLALVQIEADLVGLLAGGEIFHAHDDLVKGLRLGRFDLGDLAADHILEDLLTGDLTGLAADDDLTVAQDDGAVGQLLDLVEEVGNEEDAGTLLFEVADDLEQLGLFLVGEGGSRLVEEQDLVAGGKRTGDLYHLPLADGKVDDLLPRVDVAVHLREIFLCDGIEGFIIYKTVQAGNGDVFRDGHIVEHDRLLMDKADAVFFRVLRGRDADRLAVDQDLTFRRLVNAAEDIHERRFTGAVDADESNDLSASGFDVDVVQSLDAGEDLGNMLDL